MPGNWKYTGWAAWPKLLLIVLVGVAALVVLDLIFPG